MCNNSLIYLATPTVSSVTAGGILPLTTIVRRRGSSVQQSNDSIVLSAPGYYHVSVGSTFTAPAAGVATIRLLQDGVAVQGATASTSITTETTEVRSLSFDAIVRIPSYGSPVTLTVVNSGMAITPSNIAVAVEYLD